MSQRFAALVDDVASRNTSFNTGHSARRSATRFVVASFLVAVVFVLASHLFIRVDSAFADDVQNACLPTEEQVAAYEADGTMDARVTYQEELDNGSTDQRLIQLAQTRDSGLSPFSASVLPVWKSGMPTEGNAHAFLVRVSFPSGEGVPAMTFDEADSPEAFADLFSGSDKASYPYDGITNYYRRASYGKLTISAGSVNDYTTLHPRDYYTKDVSVLFDEVFRALNDTVAFQNYDGNNDGIIDSTYLHIAGGNTGWGSTWWSSERIYSGEIGRGELDGKMPGNIVLLSDPCAVADSETNPRVVTEATAIAIHETGHVLGLPDLYSYKTAQGDIGGRTGPLTFDMMMNNTGDHNGFFKWLLGWLDDQDITRVIANDEGLTVKRGDAVIERIEGSGGQPLETALSLAGFTSGMSTVPDDATTGGIIVVSNEDGGLFSSYYLLQYDQYAGNQSVMIGGGTSSGEKPLPSGFRLYRVEAAVNADGTDFAKGNDYGSVHNQLIELVDPDMDKEHVDAPVPFAVADPYHCMLFSGDSIGPTSSPVTTNFGENIDLGFTGLSFAVTKAGGTEDRTLPGEVSLSYSADASPTVKDFTLTPLSGVDDMLNMGSIVLEASTKPHIASGYDSYPYLLIDGEKYDGELAVDGREVSFTYMLNDGILHRASDARLVLPAGALKTYEIKGTPYYSPAMELSLAPDGVTEILHSGLFSEKETGNGFVSSSNVSSLLTFGDGRVAFFQKITGKNTIAPGIYLQFVDADDPSRVGPRPVTPFITPDSLPQWNQIVSVQGIMLDADTAVLSALADDGKSFLYR